jgi:threonine dehydrogenase-like Zn-dependent dehydrogenase
MIRLQNNYAITSNGGSFALVTFVKGKDKEGNEIDVQKPISYHTTLKSALQSYSNNRMADLVSNVDLDLEDLMKAIIELKKEIKAYECK